MDTCDRDSCSMLKLVVFLSSVREGRMATRVNKFIHNQLGSKYDITVLDPEKLDLPMIKMPVHDYKNCTEVPKTLQECEKTIKDADAFLVVTAEYNHSIPPALSNLLDYFPPSLYAYRPSGIVSYSMGMYAGIRAAIQLRALLGTLGAPSMPELFGIPSVHSSLDENGQPQNEHLVSGLDRLITQLDWHAHAMKNHREKFGVPKM